MWRVLMSTFLLLLGLNAFAHCQSSEAVGGGGSYGYSSETDDEFARMMEQYDQQQEESNVNFRIAELQQQNDAPPGSRVPKSPPPPSPSPSAEVVAPLPEPSTSSASSPSSEDQKPSETLLSMSIDPLSDDVLGDPDIKAVLADAEAQDESPISTSNNQVPHQLNLAVGSSSDYQNAQQPYQNLVPPSPPPLAPVATMTEEHRKAIESLALQQQQAVARAETEQLEQKSREQKALLMNQQLYLQQQEQYLQQQQQQLPSAQHSSPAQHQQQQSTSQDQSVAQQQQVQVTTVQQQQPTQSQSQFGQSPALTTQFVQSAPQPQIVSSQFPQSIQPQTPSAAPQLVQNQVQFQQNPQVNFQPQQQPQQQLFAGQSYQPQFQQQQQQQQVFQDAVQVQQPQLQQVYQNQSPAQLQTLQPQQQQLFLTPSQDPVQPVAQQQPQQIFVSPSPSPASLLPQQQIFQGQVQPQQFAPASPQLQQVFSGQTPQQLPQQSVTADQQQQLQQVYQFQQQQAAQPFQQQQQNAVQFINPSPTTPSPPVLQAPPQQQFVYQSPSPVPQLTSGALAEQPSSSFPQQYIQQQQPVVQQQYQQQQSTAGVVPGNQYQVQPNPQISQQQQQQAYQQFSQFQNSVEGGLALGTEQSESTVFPGTQQVPAPVTTVTNVSQGYGHSIGNESSVSNQQQQQNPPPQNIQQILSQSEQQVQPSPASQQQQENSQPVDPEEQNYQDSQEIVESTTTPRFPATHEVQEEYEKTVNNNSHQSVAEQDANDPLMKYAQTIEERAAQILENFRRQVLGDQPEPPPSAKKKKNKKPTTTTPGTTPSPPQEVQPLMSQQDIAPTSYQVAIEQPEHQMTQAVAVNQDAAYEQQQQPQEQAVPDGNFMQPAEPSSEHRQQFQDLYPTSESPSAQRRIENEVDQAQGSASIQKEVIHGQNNLLQHFQSQQKPYNFQHQQQQHGPAQTYEDGPYDSQPASQPQPQPPHSHHEEQVVKSPQQEEMVKQLLETQTMQQNSLKELWKLYQQQQQQLLQQQQAAALQKQNQNQVQVPVPPSMPYHLRPNGAQTPVAAAPAGPSSPQPQVNNPQVNSYAQQQRNPSPITYPNPNEINFPSQPEGQLLHQQFIGPVPVPPSTEQVKAPQAPALPGFPGHQDNAHITIYRVKEDHSLLGAAVYQPLGGSVPQSQFPSQQVGPNQDYQSSLQPPALNSGQFYSQQKLQRPGQPPASGFQPQQPNFSQYNVPSGPNTNFRKLQPVPQQPAEYSSTNNFQKLEPVPVPPGEELVPLEEVGKAEDPHAFLQLPAHLEEPSLTPGPTQPTHTTIPIIQQQQPQQQVQPLQNYNLPSNYPQPQQQQQFPFQQGQFPPAQTQPQQQFLQQAPNQPQFQQQQQQRLDPEFYQVKSQEFVLPQPTSYQQPAQPLQLQQQQQPQFQQIPQFQQTQTQPQFQAQQFQQQQQLDVQLPAYSQNQPLYSQQQQQFNQQQLQHYHQIQANAYRDGNPGGIDYQVANSQPQQASSNAVPSQVLVSQPIITNIAKQVKKLRKNNRHNHPKQNPEGQGLIANLEYGPGVALPPDEFSFAAQQAKLLGGPAFIDEGYRDYQPMYSSSPPGPGAVVSGAADSLGFSLKPLLRLGKLSANAFKQGLNDKFQRLHEAARRNSNSDDPLDAALQALSTAMTPSSNKSGRRKHHRRRQGGRRQLDSSSSTSSSSSGGEAAGESTEGQHQLPAQENLQSQQQEQQQHKSSSFSHRMGAAQVEEIPVDRRSDPSKMIVDILKQTTGDDNFELIPMNMNIRN